MATTQRSLRVRRRRQQRGSAMLVTLIIIGALIAGAATLLSIQMASNRSSDLTRSGMTALYCAEAGLAAARPVIAAHYADWNAALCDPTAGACTEPTWLSTEINATYGGHDLDGDGLADFEVYLRDNYDEISVTAEPTVDHDLQVFVVSRCIKYADTPKQVEELVLFDGGAQCYGMQAGGCSGGGGT